MTKPPQKSVAMKVYAAPLAILLMAGALAPSPAVAEPSREGRTVQSTFTYNPKAPAAEIYADLAQAVERLCRRPGPRPLFLRRVDEACMADAMADAVRQIGRTDIAQLHANNG